MSSCSTTQYRIHIRFRHPLPFAWASAAPSTQGFHQGNSYLLLKTQLRVQTGLTGSTGFDNALCSKGFVDGAPQLLSCFTAMCIPAMHPALDMQRQEARPGLQQLDPDKKGTVC